MSTVGAALTVTATGALAALHPDAFVTVTEYEPVLDTVIDCVVAPFDHA